MSDPREQEQQATKEFDLDAETVQDLEVEAEDAEDVRGGNCDLLHSHCANSGGVA